jgi:type IV pilus assembly protein PilM
MRQYTQALQRQFMLDAIDAEDLFRRACRDEARVLSGEGAPERGLAAFAAEGEAGGNLRDAAADPRVREVIGQISDKIAAEIKKTFDFYETQAMREHFDAVFLAGGGAHIPDLARRLESRLGWPVERLDPLRRVQVPPAAFDADYVLENGPQASIALGLALRGVTE